MDSSSRKSDRPGSMPAQCAARCMSLKSRSMRMLTPGWRTWEREGGGGGQGRRDKVEVALHDDSHAGGRTYGRGDEVCRREGGAET